MSLFGKIFGGKPKEEQLTPQQAIQKLRETEELLFKKQEFVEKKIQDEKANALKHAKTNKRLALHALGRKRQFEKQLSQIDGTLQTLEFQREALENSSTNAEVLSVMSKAGRALKQAHNNMDVDQVHDLMDDIAEQQQVANEIAEAISNPVGFQSAVDDDELLQELEGLEQEELDRELLNVNPTPAAPVSLPDVPSAPLPASAAKNKPTSSHADKELEELDAWVNA